MFQNSNQLPTLIIRSDHVLTGFYQGFVQVESGTCTILGTLQGSLAVLAGASVYINGLQQGNMYVFAGAKVIATGEIQGTAKIEQDATLIIEETGVLEGLLSNDGEIIIRGVISGGQIGSGKFQLEGKGYIKKPIFPDGAGN
jgi:hypothetical protein